MTCRRWNRRQGPRARLTEQTTSGIFLLESVAPMPVADVMSAAAELAEPLEKFSPGARTPGTRRSRRATEGTRP
ncbi:hypothetical protein GCM10027072_24810 [Streptomyces bullii]